MIGEAIHILEALDGTPVCNVSFDLSAAQLAAAARAAAAIRLRRHRGQSLDTDDVLALRDLTSLCDELDRLAEQQASATVVLSLAQLALLHDVLGEWCGELDARGWGREQELADRPLIDAMTGPLAALRERAVARALTLPPSPAAC